MFRSIIVFVLCFLLCISIVDASINQPSDQSINQPIKRKSDPSINQSINRKSTGWSSLIDRSSPYEIFFQNFRYFYTALADPFKFAHPINQPINQPIDQSIDQSIDQPIDQSIDWSCDESIDRFQQETLQDILHFNDRFINRPINQPISQRIEVDPSISIDQFQSTDQSISQSVDQLINQLVDPSINQSIDQPINESSNPSINQSFINCNFGRVVTFTRSNSSIDGLIDESIDVCYCPIDMINSRIGDCSAVRPFTCHPRLIDVSTPQSTNQHQSTNQGQSNNQLINRSTICSPPQSLRTTLDAHDGPMFTPIDQSTYRSSEFALYDPRLTGSQPPCVATINQPINQFTFAIDCSFNTPASEGFAQPAQVEALINQGYTHQPIKPFTYVIINQSVNQSTNQPVVTFAVVDSSPVTDQFRIDWTILNTAFLSNRLTQSVILTNDQWQAGQVTINQSIDQSMPKGSRVGGRIHTLFGFSWARNSPGFEAWSSEIPWRLTIEDSSFVPSQPIKKTLKKWQGWLIGGLIGGLLILVIYRLWMWRKDRKFQQMMAEQKATSQNLFRQTS